MRQTTFKVLTQDSVATYPDEMCFAFNPNFIEIESGWPSGIFTVEVSKLSGLETVATQSIRVSFYKGKCKIYLSRLFELMFDDPRNSRCVEVGVNVKIGTLQMFSFTTLVIWGNLAVGERFGNLGVYNRDADTGAFQRNLIWFRNFPFSVSLFRYNQEIDFFGRYDNGRYSSDPIYRDTKVCFFEKIEKLASTLPTITSGSASLPFEVVYYAVLKRFIVKKDDKYYTNLVGDDTEHWGSTADYCDTSNGLKPRTDITYLLETERGFARYRFMNDELVYCGMFTDLGFEDIPPANVFPNAKKTATIKYKISDEDRMMSVFDRTFDYTFFQTGENVALINLKISNETAGHYLRWVDRHGNLQYFLFPMGNKEYKNKLGSNSVLQDDDINGLYFANIVRTRNIECTVTHKCCAVNLPADIYEYVATIITSPIIDLYCGKDEHGNEIWLPVNIQANTVKYSPRKMLNNLEFSFALPAINAQTL
ncbi:MAG: hypothetical protein NC453_21960 [Muribaculum sp.]|nr:hypothetical protein [Muribaculum sp.]